MVKKILYLLPVILLLELFRLPLSSTAAYFPGSIWRTIDNPEEAGWSSKKLTLVQQAADKMDCIGGMILYDGKIVCKWGDITKRGALHSGRKSLLSALLWNIRF